MAGMHTRETRLRLLALIGDISSQSEEARCNVCGVDGLLAALIGMVAAPNELQSTRESALVGRHVLHVLERSPLAVLPIVSATPESC